MVQKIPCPISDDPELYSRTIETVWRIESARLIASLTRLVRDVGLAEDLVESALVAALEQWSESGIPDNPGAWLMTTAKHHAIDQIRRHVRLERKTEELGRAHEIEHELQMSDFDSVVDDEEMDDDLLRLIFIACHPILSTDARVALTLRLLGGLTTEEIARAFLVSETTIAQRIVRAKRTLAEAHVPFQVPASIEQADVCRRHSKRFILSSMKAIRQPSAMIGIDPRFAKRRCVWVESSRNSPSESDVHELVALMEFHASRLCARVDSSGKPILLFDQNRARWDPLLIQRGFAALARADNLGGPYGPYVLQASIAAYHARARTSEETDWHRIVALYDALVQLRPSPIVELNRAMAVAMAYDPEAGLEIVDELSAEPAVKQYHLLPSVRGDLLVKLIRLSGARVEFERAASLTRNERERILLLEHAAGCTSTQSPLIVSS